MIDAILFDLDGTLVDSVPGIEYSMRCALTATCPGHALCDIRALLGPPIRAVFERALGPLPPATLDELEREFRASYDATGWRKARACERAASTLGGLVSLGVRNFVVTNKPKTPTQHILAELRLDGFCSGIVCPDSVSPPLASKTEVVRHAIHAFALLGSGTLLVGDSVDDARAAQALGIRFVAMSEGYGDAHRQAEVPIAAVCATLNELLPLVRTWRRQSGEVSRD